MNRLDDQRGDVALAREQLAGTLGRVVCGSRSLARVIEKQRRAAQHVRERPAKALDPADRQRAERQPMVRAAICGEARLAGRENRGLERGFDRLGSGRCEKDPLQVRRQDGGKTLVESHAQLRWMNVAHAVHQPPGLPRDRVGDARIAMAGVDHAERGGAVDVLVAVGVGHRRAVCRIPKHRKIVREERNVAGFVAAQQVRERFAARAGYSAHVSSLIQRTNSAIRGRPP